MTRRSRIAAPITAAALAVLAATGCTGSGMGTGMSTGMGPSAPAADRTGTAGSAAGAADARVGAPGERMQERGAPGASAGQPPAGAGMGSPPGSAGATTYGGAADGPSSGSASPGATAVPPPIAQADDEALRACATYRQMMAGKSPLEQQMTWAQHLQRVHGITDPQEAAMHQRNVERTCAQMMPGGMR